MYVPEFLVGIACTLAVEMAIIIICASVGYCKGKKKPKEENNR